MLQVYAPKKKIVVRYLENEKGELCRVYFAVAEWNGQVFVKPIKAELVESGFNTGKACCLPGVSEKIAIEIKKEIGANPNLYFSKKDFQVMGRKYEVVYPGPFFSFHINVLVDLKIIDKNKYIPKTVNYEGNWDIPGRKLS